MELGGPHVESALVRIRLSSVTATDRGNINTQMCNIFGTNI